MQVSKKSSQQHGIGKQTGNFNMEKRFDHIISLGLNCEISFILKKKFNFVESSLLSWSYIPISSLNDVLKNPQLIFSEGIEDLTEYNMFKCSKTGIAFHGKNPPSFYTDKKGNIDQSLLLQEKNDVISRVEYLKQKFIRVGQSSESKLYVLGISHYFTQNLKQSLKDIILNCYEAIAQSQQNASLLVLLEKDIATADLFDLSNIYIYIRILDYFAPIDKATFEEYVDLKNAFLIFKEFVPTMTHTENKTYKFEKNVEEKNMGSNNRKTPTISVVRAIRYLLTMRKWGKE